MKNDKNTSITRKLFAENLRIIRRLKNLSQEELAHNAGISRVYLSDIERANKAVTIDIIGQLAQALDIEIASLFSKNLLLTIANNEHKQ